MTAIIQQEIQVLHRKVDALGLKMEQMGENVARIMPMLTAVLAAMGGHPSLLAQCDPADVALLELTTGRLSPKARTRSRASTPDAPTVDGCDTRLPPTPTSGPVATPNVLGDWANQSPSVKAAPVDAPTPAHPSRARDYKMIKIRVQKKTIKEHKLMAALLKPAEEGFDSLPPSHLGVVRRGASVGVVASDTPFVEPELLDEKKDKGRGEKRLSYHAYLVALRDKKRSSRKAPTVASKADVAADKAAFCELISEFGGIYYGPKTDPAKRKEAEEPISHRRRALIRRARAIGLANRTYNLAAVRAAAVAVQKFWAKILRPSRRHMRPLVSAFSAPLGEALAKMCNHPNVAAKPICVEPAAKEEEGEVPAAVVEGMKEEGDVVPKLEVSVRQHKARIEAEQAVAQAAAGGHLQRTNRNAGHMADVSAAIQGRPAIRDILQRIKAEGFEQGLGGFRTQAEDEVCMMGKNKTIHVSSPKAKPFTELDRAASSVTSFAEGGEAQAGGVMEVCSSPVVGELEVFGG